MNQVRLSRCGILPTSSPGFVAFPGFPGRYSLLVFVWLLLRIRGFCDIEFENSAQQQPVWSPMSFVFSCSLRSSQDLMRCTLSLTGCTCTPCQRASFISKTDSFSWGHDPYTLACKARPSFDGCGTSLSVSLSLSLSLLGHAGTLGLQLVGTLELPHCAAWTVEDLRRCSAAQWWPPKSSCWPHMQARTGGGRENQTKGCDVESLLIEARTRHGRPPLTSHQSSGCLAETRPDGSACSHPLECVWANSGWDKGVPRVTTPCRRTDGDLSPLQTTAAQVVHCAASKNTRQLAQSIRFGICVWFMCMGPQLFLQDWRCGQRREEHARHKYRQRAGRGVHWPPGAERLLREIDAGRGRTRLASVRRPAPLTHLGGCRGCCHHRHSMIDISNVRGRTPVT